MIKNWAEYLPVTMTVCDAEGTMLYMNPESVKTFSKDGGSALLGSNLLDCHPEPSRTILKEQLETHTGQTYITDKNGVKKLIHQTPWYEEGDFKGMMELIIPIPEDLEVRKR